MLHTGKTDQAYRLLKSYARTPDQEQDTDLLYEEVLRCVDSEDQIIIYLLGLTLDGLRHGNWFWNMPPSAPLAPADKAARPGR